MRVMGKKPATLKRVAEFIEKTQAMVRGEEVTYGEIPAPVKFAVGAALWALVLGWLGFAGRVRDVTVGPAA